MEPAVLLLAVFAAGYVAAVYSWPRVRQRIYGAEVEAGRLNARAEALLARANVILER